MHWVLIIFELAAAMIIGYALMPMIANARIRYAYESTANRKPELEKLMDDETDSPVKAKKGGAQNRKIKGGKKVAEIVPLEIEAPDANAKELPPKEFRGTMDEGMKFM